MLRIQVGTFLVEDYCRKILAMHVTATPKGANSWVMNSTHKGISSAGGVTVGRDKAEDQSMLIGNINNVTDAAIGMGAGSTATITNVTYQTSLSSPKPSSVTPLSSLVIGREDDLHILKMRLGLTGETFLQVLSAIRGWPGIDKAAIATVLAQRPQGTEPLFGYILAQAEALYADWLVGEYVEVEWRDENAQFKRCPLTTCETLRGGSTGC